MSRLQKLAAALYGARSGNDDHLVTAHTHVTDARLVDGKFEMVLMGKGELDSVEYVKAMHDAGWDDFITVEVSTRVWSKEEYDPIYAAKFSYRTMDDAFKKAGVPRG